MVVSIAGCSKGGDSGSTTPPTPNPPTPNPPVVITESDITFVVKIDNAEVNYNGIFAVVGTSVTIDANITSTMPKDGVEIEITVKNKLDDKVVVFTEKPPASKTASNPVTIKGLKPGVHCVATVKVTSISKASNTVTRTFDLAAK
jgi:hypothetical protein